MLSNYVPVWREAKFLITTNQKPGSTPQTKTTGQPCLLEYQDLDGDWPDSVTMWCMSLMGELQLYMADMVSRASLQL